MRWKKTLQTVDVHCEGEIGRVIVSNVLDIPGSSVAQKLHHINTVDRSLLELLCSEPRSGPAGSVVLLLPPTVDEADCAIIILQPDQAHAMSGSNAICTVTAVLETGIVEMKEPETIVVLDTAAGLVKAKAQCADGKVLSVNLDMPPAFVFAQDREIKNTPWGSINYDICFGGVFYALVDVEQFDQIDMQICPQNARQLATIGVELRQLIDDQTEVAHPQTPQVNGIAYLMFYSRANDGAVRTCTTMRPGRVDRSPCGTGSTAKIALMHAKGQIDVGQSLITRSTIGGEFISKITSTGNIGAYQTVQNQLSGRAWIYAISQIGLDPSDPFQEGFRLSDTWGTIGGTIGGAIGDTNGDANGGKI